MLPAPSSMSVRAPSPTGHSSIESRPIAPSISADARERFGYDMPGTVYFSGDAWPAADRTIDLLLATETLEHIADPDAFLAQARRVLRDDGQLILTVPFSARWHYVPYDYWRFTPSALRMLLERNGFRGVVVLARGNELTVACAKVMALILPFLLPQRRAGAVASPDRCDLGADAADRRSHRPKQPAPTGRRRLSWLYRVRQVGLGGPGSAASRQTAGKSPAWPLLGVKFTSRIGGSHRRGMPPRNDELIRTGGEPFAVLS